jgi:hypothetical protein
VRRADTSTLFGGGEADALSARGALGIDARQAVTSGAVELIAPFRVRAVSREPDGKLRVTGLLDERESELRVDRIIVATGFRPDFSFLKEIRLGLDPWLETTPALAPLIDPNLHSCGTVRPHGAAELAQPEPGLFIVGMKAYGRAPTFLLATGYEQARSVVAHLAGDEEAARRVELVLPETGVCNGPGPIDVTATDPASAPTGSGCCGPAAAKREPVVEVKTAPVTKPKASACCVPRSAAQVAADGRCCDPLPAATSEPAATVKRAGGCGPKAATSAT